MSEQSAYQRATRAFWRRAACPVTSFASAFRSAQMGEESDALWDAHMGEAGYEMFDCANQYGGQCDRWPSCACGHDTRKRPYDPCRRKGKRTSQGEGPAHD